MPNKKNAPAGATTEGHFGRLRSEMREFALSSVDLPSTGRLLVQFEGMPWLGVLEVRTVNGVREGTWRNVSTVRPF